MDGRMHVQTRDIATGEGEHRHIYSQDVQTRDIATGEGEHRHIYSQVNSMQ